MDICIVGECARQMFWLFVFASVAATVIIIALAVEQVKRERKDGK